VKLERIHFALFVALLGGAIALVWRTSQRRSEISVRHAASFDALEVLLPDAALLLTLDVIALGRSPWGRTVLAGLAELAGSGAGQRCASEQLARARRISLAVPAESPSADSFDVGLVFEGSFEEDAAIGCAAALVEARRGVPTLSTLNDFRVLRDRQGAGELAVRDDGPLILSGGTYFRELVERAGRNPPRDASVRERLHGALRRKAGPAPLIATWVLPPAWLERWLGEPQFAESPLAPVRAILVRGVANRHLDLDMELSVEEEEDAKRLEAFARRLSADFGIASSARTDALAITRRGMQVTVALSVADTDPGAWLGALASLGGYAERRSHPLGSANPQQIQPQKQGAAGRTAQE
jgi:hypothetical protein